MSDPRDPLQSLWTAQKEEPFAMSLADVHARAERFQSRIRWRNWIEYAAGVFVVVAFGVIALQTPNWGVRAGAALVIAGVIYVLWNLRALASGAKKSEGASWAEYHRAELVRQRDALASVWRWYLAPLVPGMAVVVLATAFAGDADVPLIARLGTAVLGSAWIAAVFGAIGWINARAAKKLDAEIAALDRARE